MQPPPSSRDEHVDDHAVREREARDERLGQRRDEPVEGRLVPVHVAPVGRLLPDDLALLAGIAAGLRLEARGSR